MPGWVSARHALEGLGEGCLCAAGLWLGQGGMHAFLVPGTCSDAQGQPAARCAVLCRDRRREESPVGRGRGGRGPGTPEGRDGPPSEILHLIKQLPPLHAGGSSHACALAGALRRHSSDCTALKKRLPAQWAGLCASRMTCASLPPLTQAEVPTPQPPAAVAVEGRMPEIERVLEVLLRADLSPEGIAAHEAAAARERRRQRRIAAAGEVGGGMPPRVGEGGPAEGAVKRKGPGAEGPEEYDDFSSSEEEGEPGAGGGTLDIFRQRRKAAKY
jgi:hypothetical protein